MSLKRASRFQDTVWLGLLYPLRRDILTRPSRECDGQWGNSFSKNVNVWCNLWSFETHSCAGVARGAACCDGSGPGRHAHGHRGEDIKCWRLVYGGSQPSLDHPSSLTAWFNRTPALECHEGRLVQRRDCLSHQHCFSPDVVGPRNASDLSASRSISERAALKASNKI